MDNNKPPDQLWLMLGEMRGDLKFLVAERGKTSDRLDAMEADHAERSSSMDARVRRLETFKTKIGVVTTALGILVPGAVTVALHKIGLL